MPDCREQVYSNDYFDFIIPYEARKENEPFDGCIQRVSEYFDIFFYPRSELPPLGVGNFSYSSIPNCYGLLDTIALEESGIIRLQNQPVLSLKGRGVLVGFLDTGIDYTNPLFRYTDGSTRIMSIWDQTIENGRPPAGILYGAEYRAEEINQALASDDPYAIVPSRDETGHGTFLAGITCGGEDVANDFIGAAPNAALAIVKLKQAKQYLRDFFFVPDGVAVFQETDIMMAVTYLNGLAAILNMPLVICLALGNSIGSHGRAENLAAYLNFICLRRQRSIVTAAGNEANSRHHYQGRISGEMKYEDVELNVEEDMEGFVLELWSEAPELFEVSVISPTGEQMPRIPASTRTSTAFRFVFEGTTVTVDYPGYVTEAENQLIFFRFVKPRKGLWIIRVYPANIVTGNYNIWLPMKELMLGTVFFLRSNPEITLTSPGTANQVITVGGYQVADRSIYADSGRGYTVTGEIKPDFVAPAVNIYGPGLRHNYVTYTGTSVAAAVTAGAVAQIMQWALVEQNNPWLSNAGIKNMLIRGAGKSGDRSYPNREWGYGTLDVYNAFNEMRNR